MDYLETIKNNVSLAEHLDNLCDFCVAECLTELNAEYEYAKEKFRVFGTDASGGDFGFIGDGDIDTLSIGYSSSEGQSGRIAENLSDFFHLIVFYPFWHDLLSKKKINNQKIIMQLEKEYREDFENYDNEQELIAKQLVLNKDSDVLKKLYSSLISKPKFITYSTEDNNPSEDLLE